MPYVHFTYRATRVLKRPEYRFRIVADNHLTLALGTRRYVGLGEVHAALRECNMAFDNYPVCYPGKPYVEVYEQRRMLGMRKQFRYRVCAANGDIIAKSSEGYFNRRDMDKAIERCAVACGVTVTRPTVPVHTL